MATKVWHRIRSVLRNRTLVCVLLGGLVFGSRAWTVRCFGVQQPYMDSYTEVWNFDAALHGHWHRLWHNSLQPNNEHIIFFTHWLEVALLFLNGGRWDLLAGCCLNAVLAGACASAVLAGLGWGAGPGGWWVVLAAVAVGLAPPFAYDDVLWEFQSPHYLCILFSVLALTLAFRCRSLSPGWFLAFGFAGAACFTLGSGFFAALCIGVISLVELWLTRARKWRATLLGAILVLGLNIPNLLKAHGLSAFKAQNLSEFGWALCRQMAWPNVIVGTAWLAPVIFAPLLALGVLVLFRRQPVGPSTRVILGLGLWVLLTDATLAYARGSYVPYARYYDYNGLNLAVNAAAFFQLRGRLTGTFPSKTILSVFATAWVVSVLLGGMYLSDFTFRWALLHRKQDLLVQQRTVQKFFSTDNPADLRNSEAAQFEPFQQSFFPALLRLARQDGILPSQMLPGPEAPTPHTFLAIWRKFCLRAADVIALGSLTLLAMAGALEWIDAARPSDGWGKAIRNSLRPALNTFFAVLPR
ncbi:MAG TPA: hypothetical protein VGD78_07435 [Chthoniobacterales bacterium]